MGMIYLDTCDKCHRKVPVNNSARYWHIAYKALGEFRDPEIAIAREDELMEAVNDASRNEAINSFKLIYQDRHLFPVEGCEGNPTRQRFIENDFGAKMALEYISP